jgi:hypothetical protein
MRRLIQSFASAAIHGVFTAKWFQSTASCSMAPIYHLQQPAGYLAAARVPTTIWFPCCGDPPVPGSASCSSIFLICFHCSVHLWQLRADICFHLSFVACGDMACFELQRVLHKRSTVTVEYILVLHILTASDYRALAFSIKLTLDVDNSAQHLAYALQCGRCISGVLLVNNSGTWDAIMPFSQLLAHVSCGSFSRVPVTDHPIRLSSWWLIVLRARANHLIWAVGFIRQHLIDDISGLSALRLRNLTCHSSTAVALAFIVLA